MPVASSPGLDLLLAAAHRLDAGKSALDPLIHLAGDAAFVLLGEASQGTHEFYSLNRSRAEVVRYLEKVDPEAARRARYRYSCFDHFGEDEQAYGYAAGVDLSQSCKEQVVQQLRDLQQRAYEYLHRHGQVAEDEFFSAEQNARLVRNSEEEQTAEVPETYPVGV